MGSVSIQVLPLRSLRIKPRAIALFPTCRACEGSVEMRILNSSHGRFFTTHCYVSIAAEATGFRLLSCIHLPIQQIAFFVQKTGLIELALSASIVLCLQNLRGKRAWLRALFHCCLQLCAVRFLFPVIEGCEAILDPPHRGRSAFGFGREVQWMPLQPITIPSIFFMCRSEELTAISKILQVGIGHRRHHPL